MNLKYQFYQGYYANFDPRQNAVESTQRGVIESYNTGKLQDQNKRLHMFRPVADSIDRKLDVDLYHPARAPLDAFVNVAPLNLKITYPGLMIGIGYNHETGTKDEITLGLYFDHTTGLPIIPGSSVKGVLRAAFPQRHRRNFDQAAATAKANFIRTCLTDQLKLIGNWTDEAIDQLEQNCFAAGKDVFLDATLHSTNREGTIVGPDFLTPHRDKPLKDPLPLRLLKVMPQVGLRFQFRLQDFKTEGIELSKENKRALFQLILLYYGIGAKTNVGYGQLMEGEAYDRRIISAGTLATEARERQEQKRIEKEERDKRELANRLKAIPTDWITIKQPRPGDKIVVFGQIEALSNNEKRDMADPNHKKKPRKRVKVFQSGTLKPSIDNKWDKRFYTLDAGTHVKMTITLGKISGNSIEIAKIENPEIIKLKS